MIEKHEANNLFNSNPFYLLFSWTAECSKSIDKSLLYFCSITLFDYTLFLNIILSFKITENDIIK